MSRAWASRPDGEKMGGGCHLSGGYHTAGIGT